MPYENIPNDETVVCSVERGAHDLFAAGAGVGSR